MNRHGLRLPGLVAGAAIVIGLEGCSMSPDQRPGTGSASASDSATTTVPSPLSLSDYTIAMAWDQQATLVGEGFDCGQQPALQPDVRSVTSLLIQDEQVTPLRIEYGFPTSRKASQGRPGGTVMTLEEAEVEFPLLRPGTKGK